MQSQSIPFLDLLNGQVQYVVPYWQRRYRWGKPDIERLIEDLVTVASLDNDSTHYGGTLLTFPEPGPAGVVKSVRVVDGQQRLTTVSILLACIADKLGEDGNCDGWTAEVIRNDRLFNSGKSPQFSRKLKLQDGDEDEYRCVLEGGSNGAGAVTQAWKILRRLVSKHDVSMLLKGLCQLRVVSIGVENEDPQQIFESLNATGQPLTESEKVKNWLLIGRSHDEQKILHNNYWLQIVSNLNAHLSTEPIDVFLRDLLRWKTGEIVGIGQTYENFRRWAIKQGKGTDKFKLCVELAELSKQYGILTGTAGKHPSAKIEKELRHLRALGVHVHRPLSLRILSDTSIHMHHGNELEEEVSEVFAGISTWITRLWLADRRVESLNRKIADMAFGGGPTNDEDLSDYWLDQIRNLRNTRLSVPDDNEVAEGIRTRKAYGSSATKSSFAVLYALVESDHKEETPPSDRLTIEHVMPQKLTEDWRLGLGEDAELIHGRFKNLLANLTLSGDATNSSMGTSSFTKKCDVYRNSSIGITRQLAEEDEWNIDALERRSDYLIDRATSRWPWEDKVDDARTKATFKWRIEQGGWHAENVASQLILNVTAALLDIDPENADRLSGEAVSRNVFLASRYPADYHVGSIRMRAIPGHPKYVMHPYRKDYPTSANFCRTMGQQCGVNVEVEYEDSGGFQPFWLLLKETTGGLPGQKESWRGASQWTKYLNDARDFIGVSLKEELISISIRNFENESPAIRNGRMQNYTSLIQEYMGDQSLSDDFVKNAEKGWSIEILKDWAYDDKDGWLEAVIWIKDQVDRLEAIMTKRRNL